MTVKELIEILATMDPDSVVYIPAEGPRMPMEEVSRTCDNGVELG